MSKLQRRRCKCQLCGADGWNDEFYRVKKGSRNLYYCNEDAYKKIEKEEKYRKDTLEFIAKEIFGLEDYRMVSRSLQKELNRVSDIYNREVVYATVKLMERNIEYSMRTIDFTNEYGRARYFIAIIENNINAVWEEWNKRQKLQSSDEGKSNPEEVKRTISDIEVMQKKQSNVKGKRNSGILDFLK